VPVVSQNTLNWGSLAERLDYNSFPLGVFAPHPVRDMSGATWADFWTFVRTRQTPNLPVRSWQAQYVLLDLTRPWFVLDRGCEFIQGACRDEEVAREFNVMVIKARQEMDTVYDQGGFLILRRPGAALAPPPAQAGQPVAGQTPPVGPDPVQTPAAPAAAPAGTPGPAGQTPVAPGAPWPPATPGASALPTTGLPAAPPAPAAAPETDLGTEIEVEVLDRVPSQRPKKTKPATGGIGDAASQTPPAPAAEAASPALTPDAAPAAEPAPRRSPRPRRPKPEAVAPDPGADAAQPAPGAEHGPTP
jgi:hypothetical protein